MPFRVCHSRAWLAREESRSLGSSSRLPALAQIPDQPALGRAGQLLSISRAIGVNIAELLEVREAPDTIPGGEGTLLAFLVFKRPTLQVVDATMQSSATGSNQVNDKADAVHVVGSRGRDSSCGSARGNDRNSRGRAGCLKGLKRRAKKRL